MGWSLIPAIGARQIPTRGNCGGPPVAATARTAVPELSLIVRSNEYRDAVRCRSRIPWLTNATDLDHSDWNALTQHVDREPAGRGGARMADTELNTAMSIRVSADADGELTPTMSDFLELGGEMLRTSGHL